MRKGKYLVGSLLVMFLLASCGRELSVPTSPSVIVSTSGSDNTPSSNPASEDSISQESTSEDSTSAVPLEPKMLTPEVVPLETLQNKYNASNPIEISFWTGFGGTIAGYVENAIQKFNERYDFIKVILERKGGYHDLYNAMTNSIKSSSYPNVAVGYPDHFVTYISSQIQYELDTFIDSEHYPIDLSDYYENYLRDNQSLMYKNMETKTDPYTVGLPFNRSTEVMVYNKSLFDALKLTPPKTWAEVESTGAQIIAALDGHFGTNYVINYTDGDGTEKSYTMDLTNVTKNEFYPLSWDSQSNFFITMANQFGGEYTEMGDTLETGYIKFNNPQVKEALTYIQDLARTKHILGIPPTWDELLFCSLPFRALKSVMTISSSAGVVGNIPTPSSFSVGISAIPYKDASNKHVISQGANLGIFKSDADHATASWLLVRYLTGGEHYSNENANVDFCINSGYLPVTKSGESSTKYQNYINFDLGTPADRAKTDTQKTVHSVYVEDEWDMFIEPAFIGSATIREEVEKLIPFVVTGDSGKIYTPQEAIDYAYSRLTSYQQGKRNSKM